MLTVRRIKAEELGMLSCIKQLPTPYRPAV